MTCPKKTSWMSEGDKPEREIAALEAVMPSSGAVIWDNEPLNFPTGVRAAPRMTTSYASAGLEGKVTLSFVVVEATEIYR
jgi:hypothetical protein